MTIGSKWYLWAIHCVNHLGSIIASVKPDAYWPSVLFLNKRTWRVKLPVLITVIILSVDATYVHDQLKPSFKKQQNIPYPTVQILSRKSIWTSSYFGLKLRFANYFSLNGKFQQSWARGLTLQTILLWMNSIHCIHRTPHWSN